MIKNRRHDMSSQEKLSLSAEEITSGVLIYLASLSIWVISSLIRLTASLGYILK